ncbi:MAG: hypothetical protein HC901_02535 [Bdellovibrionaceae bacterium]|nr:hypothetical protein [Pseudobdellovibrionaceae bacterium]
MDTDGGGISDVWERHLGTGPLIATEDTDGTATTTRSSIISIPTARSPEPPRINIESPEPSDIQVSFFAPMGQRFDMEFRNDLFTGNWTSLTGNQPGSNASMVYSEDPSGLQKRFFRVVPYGAIDSESDGLDAFEEWLAGTSDAAADTDSDGLPDAWEATHAGFNGNHSTDALEDLDHDGFSNLEEYEEQSDVEDYYSRPGGDITPVMVIISGNNQTGQTGQYLQEPLVVEVRNAADQTILVNASATFSVDPGDGELRGNATGGEGGIEYSTRTQGDGRASAYFKPLGAAGGTGHVLANTGGVEVEFGYEVVPTPFTIDIVYPTPQTVIIKTVLIALGSIAQVLDGGSPEAAPDISSVEFYVDGNLASQSNYVSSQSPDGVITYYYFESGWLPAQPGNYAFTARAVGNSGVVALSPTQLLSVKADADGDELTDDWEQMHGLDITRDDSMEDLDGDRIPNLFEYKRQTLPGDAESRPDADFVVDPVHGEDDASDNIFASIGEALAAAEQVVFNPQNLQWEYPHAWAVIDIKAGVYHEPINIGNVPVVLQGELGAPQEAVEIWSPMEFAAILGNTCALDGLVLTHPSGVDGAGVYAWSFEDNPRRC